MGTAVTQRKRALLRIALFVAITGLLVGGYLFLFRRVDPDVIIPDRPLDTSSLRNRLLNVMQKNSAGAAASTSEEIMISVPQGPAPPSDLHILDKRIMLFKKDGSGYFLQHPTSGMHWYEFKKKHPDGAYAWKMDREARLDASITTKGQDVSLPQRKHLKLSFDITPLSQAGVLKKGSDTSEWVDVGSTILHAHRRYRRGLVCPRNSGCESDMTPAVKAEPRQFFKTSGGAFREAGPNGEVWLESNSDGGDWLFRFGVVHETKDYILLLDASRDMWLKIKPPPVAAPPGSLGSFQPLKVFLGTPGAEDADDDDDAEEEEIKAGNDSQQQKKNKKKKNPDDEYSPWSLLVESCDPRKTCRAARKKIDMARKAAKAGPPLHMVFSVDSGKRYEWLALAFQFWWKRTQQWQEKGSRMTRLLSAEGAKPDHLMDKVPTFVAPLPEEFKTDRYLPYNKIVSVKNWIEAEHANLPEDQIVVIMDVDIVLLEDVSYMAVDVKKGRPLGAKGFMSFTGEGSIYDKVVERYCPTCQGADPLAVPYFIHKDDLLALAPRWLEMCRKIRKDTTPWDSVTDWRKQSPLQLGWTAEQWAYLLAASEMGLRHQVREDMSAFTSDSTQELNEPMIHFSDWTVGKDEHGQKMKWAKSETALSVIPNVDPARGAVNKAMIEALQDFRAAYYPQLKQPWADK